MQGLVLRCLKSGSCRVFGRLKGRSRRFLCCLKRRSGCFPDRMDRRFHIRSRLIGNVFYKFLNSITSFTASHLSSPLFADT